MAQQRVRSHAVSSIPGLGPSGGGAPGPPGMAAGGPRGNPGMGAPGSKMDEEDVE